MTAPTPQKEPLFVREAELLGRAHVAGRADFEATTLQVLGAVVDYPSRVIGEDHEPTDSMAAVMYEAAFRGLHEAIGGARLRRDFAQTVYGHLTAAAADETGQANSRALSGLRSDLVIEALENSFPDEVGVLDEGLMAIFGRPGRDGPVSADVPESPPPSRETAPRLETPHPQELRKAITALLSRAVALQRIITTTNKSTNKIELFSDDDPVDPKGLTRLSLTRDGGKQRLFMGCRDGVYYVGSKEIEGPKGGEGRFEKESYVGETGVAGRLRLVGSREANKRKNGMTAKEAMAEANRLLKIINDELIMREIAAAS